MNFSVAFFCFVICSSSESTSMSCGGAFLRRGMVAYGCAARSDGLVGRLGTATRCDAL